MHTIIWDLSKLTKIEDNKEIFYKNYIQKKAQVMKKVVIYIQRIYFFNKKEPEKLAFSSDIQIFTK